MSWGDMHKLGYLTRHAEAEIDLRADEVVDWLKERPERIAYAMGRLGQPDKKEDRPSAADMLRLFGCMDGLERDQFLELVKAASK